MHAVVARSTCRNQNVQKHTSSGPFLEITMSKKCTPLWREAHFEIKIYKNTAIPDHFWKLRCRKSARRCSAKHVSKSKCIKPHMFRPLLEVQISKKCHYGFRSQNYKILGVRISLAVHMSFRFGSLHYIIYSTTLQYITLHNISTTLQLQLQNYTTTKLQNYTTTLHYTPLHTATLNYTTLHYTTLERSIDR